MKELDRIKSFKKTKKVMTDKLNEIINLLILALKNKESETPILSKATLMLEDFNYQNFNKDVLSGINDDLEAEDDTKLNNEDKLTPIIDDSQTLTKKPSKIILESDDVMNIINAQQKEELMDLNKLKIEVNSEVGGNSQVYYITNRIYLNLKIY